MWGRFTGKAAGSQNGMTTRPLVGLLLGKRVKTVGRDGARPGAGTSRVTFFLACSTRAPKLC